MSRNSTALRSAWSRDSTLEIDDEMEILMNHGNLMNYPKEVLETIEFAVCDPKNPALMIIHCIRRGPGVSRSAAWKDRPNRPGIHWRKAHTDSYWVWVGLHGQMLRRYDCD